MISDFIPEPAVYKLAFKANNEVAEKFQDWLAVEVLPQIRQTGGYIPSSEDYSEDDIMTKALMIPIGILNAYNSPYQRFIDAAYFYQRWIY